ncbi:hypothetical protein ABC365_06495 [Brevundimonas sp. 3P9-tot-E]|uniref:hypothetical protein n=1 Tax=Brevundimonas TaxID=41275 RepID=UPI0034D44AD4
MKRAAPVLLCLIALAACGERADTREPYVLPSEVGDAFIRGAAAPSAPLEGEQACRQAVLTLYGQGDDAVTFNAAASTVSWRAPVDGGHVTFNCSVKDSTVSLSRDGQTQTVSLSSEAGQAAESEAR